MCKWRHRVVFKSSLNIENSFPPSTNITAAEYLKALMDTNADNTLCIRCAPIFYEEANWISGLCRAFTNKRRLCHDREREVVWYADECLVRNMYKLTFLSLVAWKQQLCPNLITTESAGNKMLYSRDLLLGIKHNSVKDEFWLAVDVPICSIQPTDLAVVRSFIWNWRFGIKRDSRAQIVSGLRVT